MRMACTCLKKLLVKLCFCKIFQGGIISNVNNSTINYLKLTSDAFCNTYFCQSLWQTNNERPNCVQFNSLKAQEVCWLFSKWEVKVCQWAWTNSPRKRHCTKQMFNTVADSCFKWTIIVTLKRWQWKANSVSTSVNIGYLVSFIKLL